MASVGPCRQHGSTLPDLSTLATATQLETVRAVYGAAVARELLGLDQSVPEHELGIRGYVSNANYNLKKLTLLLFINRA